MNKTALAIVALALILSGCSKNETSSARSMYYWSTEFRMDSCKTTFLKSHRIKKLYLRYFDVVVGDNSEPEPNATVNFASAVPEDIEIVPVVFIVNDCMRANTVSLAKKISARVLQMNETNDVEGVNEIQIDCDWTNSTRNAFFGFMDELRRILHQKNIKLSTTIRLHQLSQTPPPADKGILMVYNTGDFTRLECKKPILDVNDVVPYIKNKNRYKMPLSAAYPVFGWKILFREGNYVGIMHSDDELPVLPGDSTVYRRPSITDILNTKKVIEKWDGETNNEIILFDLNNKNINKYSYNDYEKIYNR